MSPESSSFESGNNPERETAGRELTMVEREALADAWFAMVMESGERPLDIHEWDNAKIRDWLNETLRHDVQKLVDDWHLGPSTELVEKIQSTPDAEHRTQLEIEFFTNMKAKLYPLGHGNDRSGAWDSYPKLMRQSDTMNCVAKSLLTKELLDRAGIKNSIADPANHAMNIVNLSNGEFWYIDSTSGIVKRIQPETRDMAGVTVLQINDPEIEYQLLPLLNDNEYAKSIVGNFRAMHDEATVPEGYKSEAGWGASERTEAQELFKIFRTEFAATDWDSIWDNLYTKHSAFEKNPEWKVEKHRVGDFQEAFHPIMSEIEGRFGQMTDPEEVMQMRNELGDNFDGIKSYITEDNQGVLGRLGTTNRQFVESLKDRLAALSNDKPQVAQEVTDHLMANWKRFKE